jgi:hypothetical protein
MKNSTKIFYLLSFIFVILSGCTKETKLNENQMNKTALVYKEVVIDFQNNINLTQIPLSDLNFEKTNNQLFSLVSTSSAQSLFQSSTGTSTLVLGFTGTPYYEAIETCSMKYEKVKHEDGTTTETCSGKGTDCHWEYVMIRGELVKLTIFVCVDEK